MKAYKCDFCKEHKNGSVPFVIIIQDRFADSRDRCTSKSFDVCKDCEKWLLEKLEGEND